MDILKLVTLSSGISRAIFLKVNDKIFSNTSRARFTSTVFVRIFLRRFYFLRRFGIHVNFVDINRAIFALGGGP